MKKRDAAELAALLALAIGALTLACRLAAGQDLPPAVRLPGGAPPPSPEVVALGQKLFNSTTLSQNRTVSCATCHRDDAGGADRNPRAVGINGRVGLFNSMTVFDAVRPADGYDAPGMFHNLRTVGLGTQSLEPILNINEMGQQQERDVLENVYADPALREAFALAYPDKQWWTVVSVPVNQTTSRGFRGRRSSTVQVGTRTVTHVNRDAYALAMTAFQSSLVTPRNSKYDRYQAGDRAAMSPSEVLGMGIFFGKGRCSQCHPDGDFTDRLGHNNGMNFATTRVLGQVGQLINGVPSRRFKTANLRRAAETPPYGADGGFATLGQVTRHYRAGGAIFLNGRIQVDPLISNLIRPFDATDEELAALEAFILSLSPEPGTSPRIALP